MSPLPWLVVLAVGLANEVAGGFADGSFVTAELVRSGTDLVLLMVIPTLLLLLARFSPHLLVPVRPSRGIPVPISSASRPAIIDVEYEEIR